MSQTQEATKKAGSAAPNNLPDTGKADTSGITPAQASDFVATGQEKVELDLEDAPFLKEEQEVEEQKPEIEQTGSEIAETKPADTAPKKKKKLLIIGGIVSFLLLIIIGVVVYFFVFDEKVLPNVIVVAGPEVQAPPKAFELKLDPFVVQCVDNNGKIHFVKGTFILSTLQNDVYFEISNNQKIIRDAIYYYLGLQDPEILLNPANHQLIKNGLFETVNKYVMSGSIDHLYIDSLLIY